MPATKQNDYHGTASPTQRIEAARAEDGHDGQDALGGVILDRLVSHDAAAEPADGHRSVSSDGADDPGTGTDRGAGAGRGELEHVPGYDPGLAESAVLAGAAVETDEAEAEPVDAWYAEFGDPRTARLLQRPDLAQALQEVVIGTDDRTQITTTTQIPWRWICSLRITAANGSQFIGTGWLVGPRTVITAGHCVYMHSQGGWAREIEVIPGRNGATRPFGSCRSSTLRSVGGWTSSHDRNFDYGAILLPAGCRYGDQLGFFGYAALNDAELLNLNLNLSGYPGDKPAGTQWFHARRASQVTPRTIVYNIDTAGGQSGSPVWRFLNGQRHAVGIHTNGAPAGNSATRITPDVAANIAAWKAAAP